MRKLLILIILCLPVVVWAQDMRKITGRVLEAASGEPLPGATVLSIRMLLKLKNIILRGQ